MAQAVNNLPAAQEAQVRSLDQKNPLEKGMATNSSILAWEIPWTKEPGGLYSSWGHKELDTTERRTLFFFKKRSTQEGYSDLLCLPESRKLTSYEKNHPPRRVGRKKRWGIQPKKSIYTNHALL